MRSVATMKRITVAELRQNPTAALAVTVLDPVA